MSTSDTSDSKRVLYLQQIDIETKSRTRFIVKLKLNNKDIEIQREGRTSTWTPSRSLEIASTSEIAIHARNQFIPFAKVETLAEISGEEIIETFWQTTDSISRKTTFDQQPATTTFKFRPSQTSKSTRDAVHRLRTAMENYGSLMSSSTKQRIDTVIKYGVAVSEMNPFAKVAFGLAKVSFDLLKEQRKYDENVSDLASGIDRILPFATQVLEDVLYDETELLDGAVRRLYELVVDTAKFTVGYAKRSPASRATKSAISLEDHKKIEELQSDFEKLKEDFGRAVDVAALRIARRNEESRLLDRLKSIDVANYQEAHRCMEGTRKAILNDIIAWVPRIFDPETQRADSDAHNIFWLYGIPGLGKTYVANSLCDRLRGSGNLGGSFFCRRDDAVLREPTRVLPNLISKLVQMWGPYRKLVAQALHDDPQLNPDSTRGELLLKPLKALKRHPSRILVLVIDALDECGEPNTRTLLLQCLKEACSLVRWLKIIITSRPEHDIKSFFDKCDVTRRDLAADDPYATDIQHFTRARMTSVARRRHLTDWPCESLINQIIERSGGLFIYVETVFRLVDDPDPKSRLAEVLGEESEGANTELHKLYSIAITSRIAHRTEEFRLILQAIVVVASYRPLHDRTLGELIGVDPSVVRSWVDELSSLLYRDEAAKDGVRVRHLSVLEFLVGPSCPSEFRVDLDHANTGLGIRCLTTMVKELKFNICGLETSYLLNTEVQDLKSRIERMIPDALQYSCMYWSDHLCCNSDPVSVTASELLEEFFARAQALYWLEALSLMERVPAAILTLRKIKGFVKKFKDDHQTLFEDILRFLLAFYQPISTSAPHIYVSALSFMPSESRLWNHISKSFPNVFSVCEGRMRSWPALPGVWQGHTRNVRSVACSHDGRYVVSGSDDGTIRIWDLETGALMGESLKGHTRAISSVAYSPDGRHVVSGSDDHTVRIWDAERGVAVGEPLKGHTSYVRSVAYSPDGRHIISGSVDNTIRIWDAERGASVKGPLKGHTKAINSVAYSPDGRHVVSGSDDYTVQIWDAERGVAVGEPLEGHSFKINSVAYSLDGRHIISGSSDQTIRIWDAERGASVGEPLKGHKRAISSVAYSPDGRHVVSGSDDYTVQIWDAQRGVAVGEPLKGHTGYVRSVAYSPDGRHIISGSSDHTIRIWDAEKGVAVGEPLKEHTGYVRSVVYSPDGRHLISGSSDHTIRVWDTERGVAMGEPLRKHTGAINSVAYSPDGRYVVSGSYDNTVQIWDAERGVTVGNPLKEHTGFVCSVAFSPDGRHVASGSDDRTVRIWDTERGVTVVEPLKGHTRAINSVAYSPDGRHVVSGSYDDTVRIWDAKRGVAVGEPLKGHTGVVRSVAYTPDGRHVVSGSDDHTVRIWDAERGVAVGEPLKGHAGYVRSVACSPDGCHVVSGSDDGTVRIWDATTGAAVGAALEGHIGVIYSVAYSPDGRQIVSSCGDRTIRIWDVETALDNDRRDVLTGSSDPTSGRLRLTAFSGLPIPSKLLESNGWVYGAEGLLFWVPEDCRNGLTSNAVMIIPNAGRHRVIRLDFADFQYGNSWTNVRGGPNQ